MSATPQTIEDDPWHLLDDVALAAALKQDERRLPALKTAVQDINEGLKRLYRSGTSAEDIVYGRARLVDRVLLLLYEHIFGDCDQPISLIAVGGYGRGELHPGSDIDLMILLGESESDNMRDRIERFLMLLWDSRLEIGHSVRTVDECVKESRDDITVATNIMESRLLTGDHTLFEEMRDRTGPDSTWNSKDFFQAKLEEQLQRNGKYNDTSYNLEPNIKESRGGLRDIQMIGWVAKRHFGADNLVDLVDHGFLRADEYETLVRGQRLLWRIRCSLHYLAGRREDRMLFDYQRSLAEEFGFQDDPDNEVPNLAIESFMQSYFRNVIELEQLNEMLLQLFREAILYDDYDDSTVDLNDDFRLRDNYIEARSPMTFQENPSSLLELFVLIQQHRKIQGVRAETIRLIREYRNLIDDDFRADENNKRLFMKILSSRRGITHELRRMHRYGILAAYLPAFESIVGRMQYDLFHAYTVDQHTLFVIRNMRRLAVPEFCHEFPLASGIFMHLKKPQLLYLAGLFHDIAKGRGGDHSELGAVDALVFCRNHGLSEDESQLVSWLVASHLKMSMIAQRRDISDPSVIREFAEEIGTLERLDHLYLLTISDIRGTNPGQWNSWKDKLFIELYSKTANLLNSDRQEWVNDRENIQHTRTDALRKLDSAGMHTSLTEDIWKNFNDAYFLRHNANEVFHHTMLISAHQGDAPLVHVDINESTLSMELLVYLPTRNTIFARVAHTLSQMNLNVINAHVMRCRNGYSLETFKVISEYDDITQLKIIAHDIEQKLVKLLTSSESLPETVWESTRLQKHFEVETEVVFSVSSNGRSTRIHIETADRRGVLAIISMLFMHNNIRINDAFISTAGEKAIDYFDITDADTGKPLDDARQQQLRAALLKAL